MGVEPLSTPTPHEALAKVKAAGSTVVAVKDLAPYQKAVEPVIKEASAQFGDSLKAIAAARPKFGGGVLDE